MKDAKVNIAVKCALHYGLSTATPCQRITFWEAVNWLKANRPDVYRALLALEHRRYGDAYKPVLGQLAHGRCVPVGTYRRATHA